ncbi:MAG: dockerin type I repeat-containing protein, partial [Prevotella sp.]|nr:dockerin type I repeat-containing protein [Prevotella sp.]
TNDNVSLTMSGGSASRYWKKTDNSTELRVYKACTMTISVPEDSKIKKIVFAGATVSGILNNGKAVTTWTGKEQEVTFTFSGTQNINTINVTVETQQAIERKPGDVNGDGLVNIADVVALVSHILGNTPDVFYEDVADLNEDGNINISDAVNLVGIILSE